MRLIHVADLHIGLLRYGQTPAHLEALLDRLVTLALHEAPAVVVFAGDTFHGKRPSPQEILIFIRLVDRLVALGCEVIYSSGNHDGPGEVDDPENKTAGWVKEIAMAHVTACPSPTQVILGGALFTVMPYVHRRSSLADRLTDQIKLAAEEHRDFPHIFVGHQSIAGSMLGAETLMKMGWDLTVEADAFDGYDYAAMGHIHYQQRITDRVWYSGSLERHDFGEASQEKGVLVVDVEAGQLPVVKQVDLGARQILSLDLGSLDDRDWLETIRPGAAVHLNVAERITPAGIREITEVATEAGVLYIRATSTKPPDMRLRENRFAAAKARALDEAGPIDALRQWCDSAGEDFEELRPLAEELITSDTASI